MNPFTPQIGNVATVHQNTAPEAQTSLPPEARAIWDRSRENARQRLLSGAEKARVKAFSLPAQQAPGAAPAKSPSEAPLERKQQCYCCGHANPPAAFECEKCFVTL